MAIHEKKTCIAVWNYRPQPGYFRAYLTPAPSYTFLPPSIYLPGKTVLLLIQLLHFLSVLQRILCIFQHRFLHFLILLSSLTALSRLLISILHLFVRGFRLLCTSLRTLIFYLGIAYTVGKLRLSHRRGIQMHYCRDCGKLFQGGKRIKDISPCNHVNPAIRTKKMKTSV